ncbi:uncharacterized protein LTR77_006361 [Saxophila tyrrhenica]|uniref:E3 ubiquitin-protein ligase listerin n=1 Tax=Saxophila tyrrhenica TaxID=1690608 RepID=A0AAV9PBL4_9PEZI|nr:hypothetical protein LTR77_006361 [Saxophila tyrrhenica]
MSKRQFKSQASSGRAGGTFGGFGTAGFGSGQSSALSYVQEPPDYSTIDDPNVVVAFKNLSKRDGTTKAKALEDLQSSVSPADALIPDTSLDLWAKLFPRLSIDNTRRVRQLSHSLNGLICSKAGKRTVKHMPRIAGPWLAGTFDNDRTVARAASEALTLVFPTTEKVQGVWKAFQRSILEYCRDATLKETVGTLSDERTVGADDANATYARVVATSLSVIGSLMAELQLEERQKEHDVYEEIFGNTQIWAFASHSDPAVRRAVYRVVRVVIQQEPHFVRNSLESISTAFLYKALHTDHSGSAVDYLHTLNVMTAAFPKIWAEAYTGKKPAMSRLRYFLKQGAQSSPAEYWRALNALFGAIPREVFPSSTEDSKDLLEAARSGIVRREERFNASEAWPTYFTLVGIIASKGPPNSTEDLLREHLLPVIKQFLFPSSETAGYSIAGPKPASIVAKAADVKELSSVLQQEWPRLGDELIELAGLSQPEQSKEFEKSQTQVATSGERWADLQRELWAYPNELPKHMETTFVTTSIKVLDESIGLMRSRNGKPYGSAAIVEQLLRQCAAHLLSDEAFRKSYFEFAEDDLPGFIFGPSQRHLIQALYAASSDSQFPPIFEKLLNSLIQSSEPMETRIGALRSIFVLSAPTEVIPAAKDMSQFQDFVKNNQELAQSDAGTALLADLMQVKALQSETMDSVLSTLVSSLSIADKSETSLSTLDKLSKADENAIKGLISRSGETGDNLLPSLLRLEQSPDDTIAERATSLASRLSSAMVDSAPQAKFGIIIQNLERVSDASLTIDAVLDLTRRMLGPQGNIENVADLLPNLDTWKAALCDIIQPPRPSLAILSPLGGAVHLVQPEAGVSSTRPAYDSDGFSQALRIAMFISMLSQEFHLVDKLGSHKQDVLACMHLTVQVAEDNLSIAGANGLIKYSGSSDSELTLLDFVGSCNQMFEKYFKSLTAPVESAEGQESSSFLAAFDAIAKDHSDQSPLAYYTALSSAKVRENLFEVHGSSSKSSVEAEQHLRSQRSSKRTLPLLSGIVGLQLPLSGTQTLTRFCNELVADLMDLDAASNEQAGLEKLVTLNTILRTQEDAVSSIAKQRLIFLVKKLIPWLELDITTRSKAEVCRALVELLPGMADMYGEHWEQSLEFVCNYWSSVTDEATTGEVQEHSILLQHSSLKLLATLNKLAKSDEPNDDLADALKDRRENIRDGLINVLRSAGDANDEMHQPLMVTNELLARQLAALPSTPFEDLGDLFPLMYAPSRAIQHGAFDLLHPQIPAAQEQISFDAALNNKTAHLPDELLSLILEAPTLDSLVDASFDRTMPLPLQGYLFSWRLLFDHFNGSSYRVKTDYIEQLKDGTYLPDLLSFTFDFLGHSRGKPVDASKFDVQHYVADTEPSPEKDVQWLLSHLFYLALMHMPTLVKSYYLDIRSRQTSLAVESWTAKHISPLIITASLEEVAEWSEKSVKEEPEYENMTVKVGMRSKEINASYLVDEQTMAMKVILPDAYPLASAQVRGVNRVAVKEEKWQSWLRNCSGVITFSNGSIADGLSAWRKNVTGTLKGQTECAICYSIISADKQLPTKRCQTCKNMFHSSCLFKWFKTSNASTCPLCRTAFNYG